MNDDALLYIYKKDGENYSFLASEDCCSPNDCSDAFMTFYASETRDYYVIATVWDGYRRLTEKEEYSVSFWVNGSKPNTPNVEYPAELLIEKSYSNPSELVFTESVTFAEVKMALSALDISGINVDKDTVSLLNMPVLWTINTETEASFTFISTPYQAAEGYEPAVVAISLPNVAVTALANVPQLDFFHNAYSAQAVIKGLKGGELITVVDINGRIHNRVRASGEISLISTSSLPHGLYIVVVRNGRSAWAFKFVR
jgi:hypothetical protein